MAMKKPVIASRTGGIPDLVQDGINGFLVPPSDASALAEAILKLANQPDEMKRMGQMGEKMAERYSLNIMIQKIESMYTDLLVNNRIL
jgi:glycosyltransferase involved in cell wall biosynthesis